MGRRTNVRSDPSSSRRFVATGAGGATGAGARSAGSGGASVRGDGTAAGLAGVDRVFARLDEALAVADEGASERVLRGARVVVSEISRRESVAADTLVSTAPVRSCAAI
jgi:hypothetical protein